MLEWGVRLGMPLGSLGRGPGLARMPTLGELLRIGGGLPGFWAP